MRLTTVGCSVVSPGAIGHTEVGILTLTIDLLVGLLVRGRWESTGGDVVARVLAVPTEAYLGRRGVLSRLVAERRQTMSLRC